MKAVVLVGGQGTRLRPLTLTTPKQMLPVGGRPMIEQVIGHLVTHGVEEVVLSLGYRPDAFLTAYPDGTCSGASLRYAVEDHPLDTAGAIAFAARRAGLDETFLVVNGDVITGLDVGALVQFHSTVAAVATIALTPVEDPSAFGVVATDADGRVEAFVEKPPPGEASSNLINAGTYVLEPAALDDVSEGATASIERETFPELVRRGGLFAMASDADWVDTGTPATYLSANLRYASDSGASGEGRVRHSVLGAGVCVEAGATVEDSVLFDGVRVYGGATVRASVIGSRAEIRSGAEVVEWSLFADGASVPPRSHVRSGRVEAAPGS
ncbi:MAG: sugar phosphate nucleotidyltransferase [Acidimicrobiales bacterium]